MSERSRKSSVAVNPRWARCVAEAMQRAALPDEANSARLRDALLALPRGLLSDVANPVLDDDVEFPVGYGCALPRVSVVARLLGILGVEKGHRVLDIHCGGGFLSAVMAQLGAQVYAVEPIGLLGQRTRKFLDAAGCQNVLLRTQDGTRGWQDYAPYDRIIFSTPVLEIPHAVQRQLRAPGGRCVAVSGEGTKQQIIVIERRGGSSREYALEEGYFLSERGAPTAEAPQVAVPRYAAERRAPVVPVIPRDTEW